MNFPYLSPQCAEKTVREMHNGVIENGDNLQSQSANEQMSTTWSKQRIDTKEMYDDC